MAQEAVARFDERMRHSHLREAVNHRLLYGEACASQLAEGDLVHVPDLVLLDGLVAPSRPSIPLSRAYQKLLTWRRALHGNASKLLRSDTPGEVGSFPRLTAQSSEGEGVEQWNLDRLRDWRSVLHECRTLPALNMAVMLWRAWQEYAPEPNGGWRAPLLSALALRTRGLTKHVLLPIDTGRKQTPDRYREDDSIEGQLESFLTWAETAALHGMKTHDQLATNEAIVRLKIRDRRKNSKLPLLVDLLLSRPIVSAPLAAKQLGLSTQAAEKMFVQLGSCVHEVTGRTRFRAWAIL